MRVVVLLSQIVEKIICGSSTWVKNWNGLLIIDVLIRTVLNVLANVVKENIKLTMLSDAVSLG